MYSVYKTSGSVVASSLQLGMLQSRGPRLSKSRISLDSASNLYVYMWNHNSLGCEQPSGLDVNQSLNVQDVFQPIPGLICCAGVTRSVVMYMYMQLASDLSDILMYLYTSKQTSVRSRVHNHVHVQYNYTCRCVIVICDSRCLDCLQLPLFSVYSELSV